MWYLRKHLLFVKNRNDDFVPVRRFEIELTQNQIEYLLETIEYRSESNYKESNRYMGVGIWKFKDKLESEYIKLDELNKLITNLKNN